MYQDRCIIRSAACVAQGCIRDAQGALIVLSCCCELCTGLVTEGGCGSIAVHTAVLLRVICTSVSHVLISACTIEHKLITQSGR